MINCITVRIKKQTMPQADVLINEVGQKGGFACPIYAEDVDTPSAGRYRLFQYRVQCQHPFR
jgi:hypothetical protein